MESFKLAVASIIAMTLLPLLTHAKPTDTTDSNKPYYCNVTRYFPRTSVEEVSRVILDAVAELNETCNENEVVSSYKCLCTKGYVCGYVHKTVHGPHQSLKLWYTTDVSSLYVLQGFMKCIS